MAANDHMATLALRAELPGGACYECSKELERKGLCRVNHPLNGREAAAEFARHLLPHLRERILGVS